MIYTFAKIAVLVGFIIIMVSVGLSILTNAMPMIAPALP